MSAKKTLEDCQELAKLRNGKCISAQYKNANTKMEWECQEGHRWEAVAGSIQQGQWCPHCSGNIPKTLEYCQELAKLRNGKCTSSGYKNNHTKMEWECQEGHRWEAKTNHVKQGCWCPYCSGLAPKTLEYCQNLAKLKNGKCTSSEYKNNHTKMEWECQEGHRWEAVAGSIRRGRWCPYCSGNAPKALEYCQELAKLKNGKCTSAEYKNARIKMEWECQEGHKWGARVDDIQQGTWCPHCHPKYSKSEKELFEIIREIYPDTEPNKKGLLETKSFELDIYVPSLKVGVEYDGEYWHNQKGGQERDLRKEKQCQEAGIRLIRISDKDYIINPEEVKRKLLTQLECAKT